MFGNHAFKPFNSVNNMHFLLTTFNTAIIIKLSVLKISVNKYYDYYYYSSIWIDSKPNVWDFSWYVSDINFRLMYV